MKRTIEINDTLKEHLNDCYAEIKEYAVSYIKENTCEEPPDWDDLDYSGRLHEIIDSNVPIYTYEIEGLWYLYSDLFEYAYENAGVGDNPKENNGMTAIYFYLWDKSYEWYDENKDEIHDKTVLNEMMTY